jgi:glycosyltransferase involved in cell wall biosynthesis
MIAAVSVLIPVRDEELLLPRCIAGLQAALLHLKRVCPRVQAEVIFALDGCSDRSEELIVDSGLIGAHSPGSGVGAARRAAAALALQNHSGILTDSLWLASTDADSVVPPNWVSHQLELATAGADIVIGSVHPDLSELDEERRAAW